MIHARIRVNQGFLNFSSNEQRVHAIESNPPIQQNGNVIRIGHMDDPELSRGISISYEITVPAETKLRIRNGDRREGIRGPVACFHGDQDRSPSHISDESVRTGSGRMQLDAIRGNLDAHTGGGSIHARQIGGRIIADTGSGSVELEQTDAFAPTPDRAALIFTQRRAGFGYAPHRLRTHHSGRSP